MRQMVDERYATDQGAKQPQRIHSDTTGRNLDRQAGHPLKTVSKPAGESAQHDRAGIPVASFPSKDIEKSPAETPRRATKNSS